MPANPLLEKMRKAREVSVECGGHRFTVRRPTDAEALEISGSNGFDLLSKFVVGWDLREIDVIPGGGPEALAFDSAIWQEWVADRPELWAPITETIIGAYQKHTAEREDAAKN